MQTPAWKRALDRGVQGARSFAKTASDVARGAPGFVVFAGRAGAQLIEIARGAESRDAAGFAAAG